MSDAREPLLDTAARILTDGGGVDAFVEAGFGGLLRAEAQEGFGGDWGDAFALLRLTGRERPKLDLLAALNVKAVVYGARTDAFSLVARAAGALDRITAMSIEHANMRTQFGRPLSKFQAVQQSLAQLAMEAAAVDAAGQGLAAAMDRGDAAFEVAAAKLRTNRAIATATALAHQAHGAIGFTQEHDLHRYTTALNMWRGAAGNDRHWAVLLGKMATARGADQLWPDLVQRTDPA